MPTSCVYLLYNCAGFCYVGQTKDLRQRLNAHRSNLQIERTCSSKLLGPDWDYEILEVCDAENLRDAEKFYYEFWSELCPGMIINRKKPGRTDAEYKRQYHANNRDKICARKKLKYAQKKNNLIKELN